jgi:hypothetical protein
VQRKPTGLISSAPLGVAAITVAAAAANSASAIKQQPASGGRAQTIEGGESSRSQAKRLHIIWQSPKWPGSANVEVRRDGGCTFTEFTEWATCTFKPKSLDQTLSEVCVCIDGTDDSAVMVENDAQWQARIHEAITRHSQQESLLVMFLWMLLDNAKLLPARILFYLPQYIIPWQASTIRESPATIAGANRAIQAPLRSCPHSCDR